MTIQERFDSIRESVGRIAFAPEINTVYLVLDEK